MSKIVSDRIIPSEMTQEECKKTQIEFLSNLKEQQFLKFFVKQLFMGDGNIKFLLQRVI